MGSFQFGNSRISYRTIRSGRRSTIGIAVTPAGKVVVSVPAGVPLSRADKAVRAKASWIYRKQLEVGERQTPSGREFVSGETFKYLGRGYRLKIVTGKHPAARLMNGRLRVSIPEGLARRAQKSVVRAALIDWYRRRASKQLSERTLHWSKRIGIQPPRLMLSDQTRRWGSCSARGEVRINWRVIQAPIKVVDYVVVHELAHLICPDHSKAYWKTVRHVLPDFPARKARLHSLGPELLW